MLLIEAVIFDLDGVIICSEELHAQAKETILKRYGIAYPSSIFNDFKGRPDLVFWQHVSVNLTGGRYSTEELDAAKRKEYFVLAENIRTVPGALEFIAWARRRFRLLALVSSATAKDLQVSDEKFGLSSWFDLVLLEEHSIQHKPHPEPYLNALKKLHLDGIQVLVIEDSPNGVESAKAAGCHVFGLTTGFTEAELFAAGADYVAASFSDLMRVIVAKSR